MKNNKIFGIFIVIAIFCSMIIMFSINNDNKNEVIDYIDGFELLATPDFNKQEVITRGYPTMLDIGGADCIPCKAMKQVLIDLNKDLQGKAVIKFIDYWKYPILANQFEFKVIPTQFFYYADGNLYTTHEGEIKKEEAILMFEEMGYKFNE